MFDVVVLLIRDAFNNDDWVIFRHDPNGNLTLAQFASEITTRVNDCLNSRVVYTIYGTCEVSDISINPPTQETSSENRLKLYERDGYTVDLPAPNRGVIDTFNDDIVRLNRSPVSDLISALDENSLTIGGLSLRNFTDGVMN